MTLVKKLPLLSQLKATDLTLRGPDNSQVGYLGCVLLSIRRNKSVLHDCNCVVLQNCTLLLSLDSCIRLGLISEDFPDCTISETDKEENIDFKLGLMVEDVEGVIDAISPDSYSKLQKEGMLDQIQVQERNKLKELAEEAKRKKQEEAVTAAMEANQSTRKELPEHLRQCWKYRAYLSVIQDLIVFNLNSFLCLVMCRLARQGEKRFILYIKNLYFWTRLTTMMQ